MTVTGVRQLGLCLMAGLLFWGCSHKPINEMVLADVSLRAAQKARADNFAPDLYRKAENYFLRAKKDYQDGYFDSCKKYADDARVHAEKAEYQSLLKQAKARGVQRSKLPF